MDPAALLLIHLFIAITIILVSILVFKWNPVVALICGSLYMGLASGVGMLETLNQITTGFGDLMASIGLSIGFGVIIGQLLYDSGGARSIALRMIRIFPGKTVIYGIGFTAFIFSIPVFFDVTFVILVPLGIALVREIHKPLPYAIGAIVIGAAAAHTMVPPTPNPLAATEIFGFDIGIMIIFGLLLGIIGAWLAMKMLFSLLDLGLWNKKRDETGEILKVKENEYVTLPPPLLAILPIIFPIILILSGTVWNIFSDTIPVMIRFISHKVTALLAGTIVAYLISSRYMKRKDIGDSAQKALSAAGLVLLITGAGGAFGAVIQETGIGAILARGLAGSSHSVIWALVITYTTGMVFRISQGSGTVAAITAMTIVSAANLPEIVNIHPVWVALAALSGGISFGHINDSGFWVTVNLSGFSVTGGLKIYTLGIFFVSLIVFGLAVLGALLMPLF